MKPEGTVGFHSVRQSVRHTRFLNFSSLRFHISGWQLVASFYMKSNRSSSTFVTIDLLFHELLHFVQNSFSEFFFAMLLYIWMIICRKLPYEELQIKFNFRQGCLSFSRVIALCSKFFFSGFSWLLVCFHISEWKLVKASIWRVYDKTWLSSRLTYFFMRYCPLFKIPFAYFSHLYFHISEWIRQSACLSVTLVFWAFLCYAFTYLEASC